jgi:TonB-dependent starch-binding outer membrane protein SusC
MSTCTRARALAVCTVAVTGIVGVGCTSALSSRSADAPSPASDTATVAYGRMPRTHISDAVASLTPQDIETSHALSVEDLLRGRLAGVQVSRTTSGQLQIRIRGISSFQPGANEPLIVIDGLPVPGVGGSSALDGISPYDIARLDVLKDAGATAAYGVQGANGVIIVTTKRASMASRP